VGEEEREVRGVRLERGELVGEGLGVEEGVDTEEARGEAYGT